MISLLMLHRKQLSRDDESVMTQILQNEFADSRPNSRQESLQHVEKSSVEAQFSKNALHYDAVATVQRRIANKLVETILQSSHLPSINRFTQVQNTYDQYTVLDVGCGTGYLGQRLLNRIGAALDKTDYSALKLTALDISTEMLTMARERGNIYQTFIATDIEAIDTAIDIDEMNSHLNTDIPYDLVMSSLAVQWCHDFYHVLQTLQGMTKYPQDPQWVSQYGIYLTTLVTGTLKELEDAFKEVDDEQHILSFLSEESVAQCVQKLGGEVSFYSETMTFPDLKSLFKSIRAVGAASLPNRRKGLLGKNDYQKLDHYFKKLGQYQLTYRVAEIQLPGGVKSVVI